MYILIFNVAIYYHRSVHHEQNPSLNWLRTTKRIGNLIQCFSLTNNIFLSASILISSHFSFYLHQQRRVLENFYVHGVVDSKKRITTHIKAHFRSLGDIEWANVYIAKIGLYIYLYIHVRALVFIQTLQFNDCKSAMV